MPKAPPRLRPPTVATTRTYARVRAFDAACPACGTVAAMYAARPGRRKKVQSQGGRSSGYDPLTGIWRCRGCDRCWYVGVVLWPAGTLKGTPADRVPTLAEASALRLELGHASATPLAARALVNLTCWCGQTCPAHPSARVGNDEEDGVVT